MFDFIKTNDSIDTLSGYNGKGDWNGTTGTDNLSAFTNALNLVDNIFISLPKGKFMISASLQIPTNKNVVIMGAGKELTQVYCTGGFFTCSNPSIFSTTLTVAGNEGDLSITVSNVAGASVGQLITFSSTQNMEETDRTTVKSHSAIITDITGNVITLDRPLPCPFSITGYTVTLTGYNVGKVRIANMTVTGEFDGYFGDIQRASGFEVENVKIVNRHQMYQGQTSTGGFDNTNTGGTMHGFRVMNAIDTKFINPELSYLSYGIMPTIGAVGTTVERAVTRRGRHTVAPTGGSQGFSARDCRAYECYAGFDSHETAYDSHFYNCHSYGDEIEVKFRGRYDVVEGCSFSGGVLARHDTGIRALSDRSKYRKSFTNVRCSNHAIFDSSISVRIDGCYFEQYVSNYQVLDLFSIENTDVLMKDGTISNNYAFWLAGARVNNYKNVRIFGPYRGVSQVGNAVSANLHKAFRIDRNDNNGTVKLENIEIDGFDYGLAFTVAMDLSKFYFENIQMKNCVYGIWNEANYKDNPTFRNLSYVGCATPVQQPYRFRLNTRPTNPIHGQQYWDETIKKPVWYDALSSAWKDATGTIA